MKRTNLLSLIVVLIFILFLSLGCNKQSTSQNSTLIPNEQNTVVSVNSTTPEVVSDDFTKVTYRTIHTMGTMYEVLMSTAGELYKEKIITEEQKTKLIDLGYIYHGSYHALVTAFEMYKKSQTDEEKISITLMVIETVKKYNKVLEYYNDITKGVKGVQQWTKISS